ncbi:MAG: oxidoreductase [Ignavibacteria bacterium]|nr:oxidoreductase [Ignavibacteria bacterium]MCC7158073.1 oxidoreductase [Ignavibacteria bacterium]
MANKKPRLAVYKMSSCDGCQLSLLDAEDELLDVLGGVEMAYFPEASSKMQKGPYDIGLVEGSITTPRNVEEIRQIRKECKILITIGACATAGGIQALRNWKDTKEFTKIVYASPEYISTLDRSMPVSAFVHVDFELRGCPINKYQLIEVLNAFLNSRKPNIPTYSVCIDCKLKGNICVLTAHGSPCMGPVTQTGCNALCPSYDRGCFGCYGPMDSANTSSLAKQFKQMGFSKFDVMIAFRSYNAYAEAFRKESEANEK